MKRLSNAIRFLFETFLFSIFAACSLIFLTVSIIPAILRKLYTSSKSKDLKRILHSTQNYEEWLEAAIALDKEAGVLGWRKTNSSSLYDYKYIERIISFMEEFMAQNKTRELIHLTRSILMRNFFGINDQKLFTYCFSGTKDLVEKFFATVEKSLDSIYNSEDPQKYEFFLEARHFFGRTGLMLSGGASFGMFHLGLVSALLRFNMLPKILCGASSGSLIASLVATKSDEELRSLAENDFTTLDFSAFDKISGKHSFLRKIRRFFEKGYFIETRPLAEFAKANTSNLTFAEAFKKTRRVLNITVTDSHYQKCRILNYLSAPNVYIWSAAIASCAFPIAYSPVRIVSKGSEGAEEAEWMPDERYFIDGSLGADLPMRSIATLFNVTNFIVSQVNLHLLPFTRRSYYHINSFKYSLYRGVELILGFFMSELIHRLRQLEELHLIPEVLSTFINLFLQEYFGNVNICPAYDFKDILYIFSNPNREIIRKWTQRGRNRTFFHKKQIEDFAKIENKLSFCANQLQSKRKHDVSMRKDLSREFFEREQSNYKPA